MPNISPDKATGIGNWTLDQFDRALREGSSAVVCWAMDATSIRPSPHVVPAPVGRDARSLRVHHEPPPVDNPVDDHELKFPYNLRRGVGWRRLAFLDGQRGVQGPVPEGVDVAQYRRGEQIPVEGAGHCAECHSPRAFMGNVVGGSATLADPIRKARAIFPTSPRTRPASASGRWP